MARKSEGAVANAALWRHRRLVARGYHKLVTAFIVLLIALGIFVKGVHFLWTAPARDVTEPDDAPDVAPRHQRSEWTREIMARADMSRKYGVYNQRIGSMADRGEIARGIADDAHRSAAVFDPANDTWRRKLTAADQRAGTRAFNPAVTLTGL